MMNDDTRVRIVPAVKFHEELFCLSYLSTEMWAEDYYALLEQIGDEEYV